MPKCQHCGAGIEGAQIAYRHTNKRSRRAQSIRLCRGCVERYDSLEAGKKTRNMMLAIVALAGLIITAWYLFEYG
jgi:hypothetical protein